MAAAQTRDHRACFWWDLGFRGKQQCDTMESQRQVRGPVLQALVTWRFVASAASPASR